MLTLFVPLSVQLSPSKAFYLNLNQYRNAHFRTLHKAKKIFTEQMKEEVSRLPVLRVPLQIRYILNPSTHRKTDIANVLSIVDKFFCDVLVECGKIPDDSYDYIDHISYLMGEPSMRKGYVEIHINEKG